MVPVEVTRTACNNRHNQMFQSCVCISQRALHQVTNAPGNKVVIVNATEGLQTSALLRLSGGVIISNMQCLLLPLGVNFHNRENTIL